MMEGFGLLAAAVLVISHWQLCESFQHGMRSIPAETCEGETFFAACGENEVIVMDTALYGRMASGRCVQPQDADSRCQTEALRLLDRKCSGRPTCEFRVSGIIDELDSSSRRCTLSKRGYLLAAYKCVKVVHNAPGRCTNRNQPKPITGTEGFISSQYANSSGCGAFNAPWVLTLPPGYRIKFEMFDFGSSSREHSPSRGIDAVCQVFAVIKDIDPKDSIMPLTICGENTRYRDHVFESTTNEVEVRVSPGQASVFLLRYSATGCPVPEPPQNGWVVPSSGSTKAKLGCNFTLDTWEVTCTANGQWPIEHVKCPPAEAAILTGSSSDEEYAALGISGTKGYVIVFGLTIAITLALVVFLIGFFVLRRKRDMLPYPARDHVYHGPSLAEYYTHAVPAPEAVPYPDANSNQFQNKPLPPRPTALPQFSPSSTGLYNDYKRTWQLAKGGPSGGGAGGVAKRHNSQSSGSNLMPVPDITTPSEGRPLSEHIYESPIFERKLVFTPIEDTCSEVRRPRFELASENGTSSAFTD